MGDMGELFRDLKEHRKEQRAKHGAPCPVCVEKLPKACPSILLPGQRCRIHSYRDPRPNIELAKPSQESN
jgi:hypothetical protein